MAEKKISKKQWYETIQKIVEMSNYENKEGAVDFIQKEIHALEAKAQKAKRRAEKEKSKPDELKDEIESVLTTNYQSIDEILTQIGEENATKNKVAARLTKLVNAGIAARGTIKMEDKRKIVGYKLVEGAAELKDAE